MHGTYELWGDYLCHLPADADLHLRGDVGVIEAWEREEEGEFREGCFGCEVVSEHYADVSEDGGGCVECGYRAGLALGSASWKAV